MVSHNWESRSRVHIRMTLLRCSFFGVLWKLLSSVCGLNCQEGSETTIEFGHMTVFRESMKKKSYWKETILENRRKVIPDITSISCTLTGTNCTL